MEWAISSTICRPRANLYGCELDSKAYKVATHLYPSAHIVHTDIRTYKPSVRFDYVVGNPPFNLKWWTDNGKYVMSQLYYCEKAAELLKPLGIMAIVVPESFLADDFTDRSAIRTLQREFRFLGQSPLPSDAFKAVGVEKYATKLQFWQRRCASEDSTSHPYRTAHDTVEWIRENSLCEAKQAIKDGRVDVLKEMASHYFETENFTYRIKKMLYQISCYKKTAIHYNECEEYIHRFLT